MNHLKNVISIDLKFHLMYALAEQEQERLMSMECLMVQKREFLDLLDMFGDDDQVEMEQHW